MKTKITIILFAVISFIGCKVPQIVDRKSLVAIPNSFNGKLDSTNSSNLNWRNFFKDENLLALIDTALKNNQELNITLQEIAISKNEIEKRKGFLKPFFGVRGGMGYEKVGTYTSQGAGDASAEITPGRIVPEILGDFGSNIYATWEIDIWKKLRNAKQIAINNYLKTNQGRNFMVTNLVAEISNAYYELLALDNQLVIVKQNIKIQSDALEIVKVQKEAARATELAVQKFKAEVLSTKGLEFEINQKINEVENDINFLLGRYPQPIVRNNIELLNQNTLLVNTGIPAQLLMNRPDILQAELDLSSSKLNVAIARAEFLPHLDLSATFGLQAFNPAYLLKLPASLLTNLAGDLAGPIINRNAIKAEFNNANAEQIASIFNYEKTVLNAFLNVNTQINKKLNLENSYKLKASQVEALNYSISIANDLFKSARADYFEVLMTQRDALEAKLELIEFKKQQFNNAITIYKELGGGWQP
jgi:NodT family efflux transporter outer membrane factor (OMF) lipoprotein